VSTDRWGEGDPWLSPDGTVLIYTRWDDEVGWAETVDLYISVLEADGWSDPVPVVELNSDGRDFGVAGSPDGRWLYYHSDSRFMRVDFESVVGRYRSVVLAAEFRQHGGLREAIEHQVGPSESGQPTR
jgi:hypothetical protein